jgi:hypothetical protein
MNQLGKKIQGNPALVLTTIMFQAVLGPILQLHVDWVNPKPTGYLTKSDQKQQQQ